MRAPIIDCGSRLQELGEGRDWLGVVCTLCDLVQANSGYRRTCNQLRAFRLLYSVLGVDQLPNAAGLKAEIRMKHIIDVKTKFD
jgi:hypothetical protein